MSKKLFYPLMLCLLFFVRPMVYGQNARIKTSINTNWEFTKSELDVSEISSEDIEWKRINLPHSYNIEDPFDDERGYYRGNTWYRKDLYLERPGENKEVFIYFEGAYQKVSVFINGKHAGDHSGGYTAFNFNITDLLEFGEGKTANEILVSVDNRRYENLPTLGGDFTFYGGIYRDVYLVTTGSSHFSLSDRASGGIYITTPEVNEEEAEMNMKAIISNHGNRKNVELKTSLWDDSGNQIFEESKIIELTSGETEILSEFQIENPKLWSIESPHLYSVHSSLIDPENNEEIDFVSNTVGFRWFSFTAQEGFMLNGKRVKLIGTNRHQDFEGMANALPDYIHYIDIKNLKKMGGNVLRVSHYPQDPAVLEWCDKLGIVVSIEIPIVGSITFSEEFTRNSLAMMEEMVKQYYNHPSIFIWAYMNEILSRDRSNNEEWLRKAKKIRKLAEKLENKVRELDPYRYTMIPNQGTFIDYYDAGLTEVPMIVGWNLYHGWYEPDITGFRDFLELHHQRLPDKPVFITEFGAGSDPRLHSFQSERFDFSVEYAVKYHRYYLQTIRDLDFVAGGTVWNLNDFGSEHRRDAVPHVNNKGLISFNRIPKEPYYFYQASLSNEPVVLIGSRNWTQRSSVSDSLNDEIATMPVIIYSNMDRVQLELNGKIIGDKNIQDQQAVFQVPFSNGENNLVASAEYPGGKIVDAVNIDFNLVPFHTRNAEFDYININAGSHQYFKEDKTNRIWLPDKEYSRGSWGYKGGELFREFRRYGIKSNSSSSINTTDNDPIYQTQRINPEAYIFDVPPGEYIVEMHFAELLSEDEAKSLSYTSGSNNVPEDARIRQFSIRINQQPVIREINLSAEAGSYYPFIQKNQVTVADEKQIVVEFSASKGDPVINAISIIKVQ